MLRACNQLGCAESEPVEVDAVEPAIGFIKSPEPRFEGQFGEVLALSGDGTTLAVREEIEGEWRTIVRVYARDADSGAWVFEDSFDGEPGDEFGLSLALSGDGHTLVVGAHQEDSAAVGIDGDPNDDSAYDSGAVFVYSRDADAGWARSAYIKGANTGAHDRFGIQVALDRAGDTLVVGASGEASHPDGPSSDPSDDSSPQAGAAYVFERGADGSWTQRHYH